MSILDGAELTRRIFDDGVAVDRRLVVTPLLNPAKQIQPGSCSLDVRIGTHFIVQSRSSLVCIDPCSPTDMTPNLELVERRLVVPFGGRFVLHPNQFALGGTLEYFSVPLDLGGYVVGRSS